MINKCVHKGFEEPAHGRRNGGEYILEEQECQLL